MLEFARRKKSGLRHSVRKHFSKSGTKGKKNDRDEVNVAICNVHICEVCRPVLDIIRGVRVLSSEVFSIVGDPARPAQLKYCYNTRSLQQSVEEGCYICDAIYDTLPSSCPAGNLYLQSCSIFTESNGPVLNFFWTLVVRLFPAPRCITETEERKDSLSLNPPLGPQFYVYREPKDFDKLCAFGPPLNTTGINNHTSDALFRYRPIADMNLEPLWELISQWINRCSANHKCSHTSTMNISVFPTRLVHNGFWVRGSSCGN